MTSQQTETTRKRANGNIGRTEGAVCEGSPHNHGTIRSPGVLRRKGERLKADVREVYFVRATTLGHIKIGVANNAWLRFMALDSSSPDPLELLGVIRSPDALKLESSIHHRFADDRIRREWFRASPGLVAYIAAHAKDRIDAFNEDVQSRLSPGVKSLPDGLTVSG